MAENVTSMQPMPTLHVSAYRQNIITPQHALGDFYVPSPKLERVIQSFLIAHQLSKESPLTPRSLLLQGDMGTGKTEIALRSALMMGAAVMFLAPSIFSSKLEGGAVEKIVEAMQEAERYSHANRLHIAILFDDIDHSSLSGGENVGRTTNPQDVVGHLQSLSTSRNVHVGFTGLPIPIIATANSASKMTPSLWRNQRAKVVTHTMDDATKHEVARKYLAPISHDESQIVASLFKHFKKEDVAFWPALASDYREQRIAALIDVHGFNHAAIERALEKRLPLNLQLLMLLAETCRKSRPFDFLAKFRSAA
jgi:hypothetical protein